MDINVYKNYYISSDKRQYILYQELKVKENGESIKDEYVTYHSTMEGALNELCSRELRASKATEIKELKEDLSLLQKLCTALCEDMGDDSVMSRCLQADKIKAQRIADDRKAKGIKEKKKVKKVKL